MKFFIKGFFSKCDQIRSFSRIWSHLLKKSLMENFILCPVIVINDEKIWYAKSEVTQNKFDSKIADLINAKLS